jgi:hypothetical protein
MTKQRPWGISSGVFLWSAIAVQKLATAGDDSIDSELKCISYQTSQSVQNQALTRKLSTWSMIPRFFGVEIITGRVRGTYDFCEIGRIWAKGAIT